MFNTIFNIHYTIVTIISECCPVTYKFSNGNPINIFFCFMICNFSTFFVCKMKKIIKQTKNVFLFFCSPKTSFNAPIKNYTHNTQFSWQHWSKCKFRINLPNKVHEKSWKRNKTPSTSNIIPTEQRKWIVVGHFSKW